MSNTPSELYDIWKQSPSPETEAQLLRGLDPLISSALKSYAQGDERYKTRAYILAKEALQTYNPKKAALNTHIFSNLKRLSRVHAERTHIVHVPENVRTDAFAVRRFVADYQDKYDREPSALLIGDNLKMSKKRIAKALNYQTTIPESQAVTEKGDVSTAEQRTPEDIWADYVYHDLDDISRKVYEHTTGYLGAPVLKKTEIAAKLKITPAAVSQRINTITKRLDDFNKDNAFSFDKPVTDAKTTLFDLKPAQ